MVNFVTKLVFYPVYARGGPFGLSLRAKLESATPMAMGKREKW